MKILCLFIFAISCTASTLHATSFSCKDTVDDYQINSEFDSESPSLISKFSLLNSPGHLNEEKRVEFLSADQVCDQTVNFRTDCVARERHHEKFGYSYSFTCEKKMLSGNIYIDENGSGEYRCQGRLQTILTACKQEP